MTTLKHGANLSGFPIVLAILVLGACSDRSDADETSNSDQSSPVAKSCTKPPSRLVRIEGGTFRMGSDLVYREEGPERKTRVDGFWIDNHEVTNRQFAEFVQATGYVTAAQKPVDPELFNVPVEQIPPDLLLPGSAVFTPPPVQSRNYSDWWRYIPGANWTRPYGPDGLAAQDDEPVVHLSWEDMEAYAQWKGGRLPTEAEWEFAASAGASKTGEQPSGDAANSWQGVFPLVNEETDGFKGIAPVGCFAANDFGLYDMVGNVWEMTSDYFRPGHDPDDRENPLGPSEQEAAQLYRPNAPSRTIKGGSYLCAPNYCRRYRPESRQGRDPGLGASNVGFRLVYDERPGS